MLQSNSDQAEGQLTVSLPHTFPTNPQEAVLPFESSNCAARANLGVLFGKLKIYQTSSL